eukprot:scaffold114910_cov21-Phaeocystis_antarctica.AAC.1
MSANCSVSAASMAACRGKLFSRAMLSQLLRPLSIGGGPPGGAAKEEDLEEALREGRGGVPEGRAGAALSCGAEGRGGVPGGSTAPKELLGPRVT